MTVREIQRHLVELYGLEASPDLISTITDAVLETVAELAPSEVSIQRPRISLVPSGVTPSAT
jgi:transposase-like protein